MKKYSKFFWTAMPLLLVLVCIGLYIYFDFVFAGCTGSTEECSGMNGNMISGVTNAENQAESNNRLVNIKDSLTNLSKRQQQKNEEINALQANVSEYTRAVGNAKVAEAEAGASNSNAGATALNANTKRLEALKTRASDELTLKMSEANTMEKEIAKNKSDAEAIRKQYSGRYSNRTLWIFLTALFIALSSGAIVYGVLMFFRAEKLFIKFKPAEHRPDERRKAKRYFWRWFIATTVVALAFAFVVYAVKERFMSITKPIFEQSIIKVNEISFETLVAFTVFGFIGAIFLIFASSAIFRKAVEVDEHVTETNVKNIDPSNPPADVEKAVTDYKVKIYAGLLKHLRAILYIGAAMLLVGILRLNYLMNWHLAFISTDATNPLYTLLESFNKSSMSVQGAFYTILLAAIYIPPALWIKEKSSQLGKTDDELTKSGIAFSYKDILQLVAIVSPMIAGALGGGKWLDFFN
jgi:hypothetical protein